ncbi:MAG: peroxiredoxin [Pseudomonadota bacterium]|nr:peroxiredoxin [Pseudomonadota bacterium]
MMEIGQQAPDFSLADSDMTKVSLSDYRGNKNVVLFFYPKDDTTGCTIEALEFTDLQDEFDSLDTVVLGVSKDNCMSHATFRDKHGLSVRLLADVEGEVCEAYEVWKEIKRGEKSAMGIVRSTFIVDKDGKLRDSMIEVSHKGHARNVLKRVQGLG